MNFPEFVHAPAPPRPPPQTPLPRVPYLSLLTADLTQPQGPLLAGGGLDPAFGADFLQERGHGNVSTQALPPQLRGWENYNQGALWHLLRGWFCFRPQGEITKGYRSSKTRSWLWGTIGVPIQGSP